MSVSESGTEGKRTRNKVRKINTSLRGHGTFGSGKNTLAPRKKREARKRKWMRESGFVWGKVGKTRVKRGGKFGEEGGVLCRYGIR